MKRPATPKPAAPPKRRPGGPSLPESARAAKIVTLRLSPEARAELDARVASQGVGRGGVVERLLRDTRELERLGERYDVPIASVAEIAIQMVGQLATCTGAPGLEQALLAALALPEGAAEYERVVGAPPPASVLARAEETRRAVEALRRDAAKAVR